MNDWHKNIFALLLVGLLSACHQISKEEREVFETPFPQELFASYWNEQQGDMLVYISNAGEVLKFQVFSASSNYIPYTEQQYASGEVGKNEGLELEYFGCSQAMRAIEYEGYSLHYYGSCSMRNSLEITYVCGSPLGERKGGFQVQTDKSTNDIFSSLADTIKLSGGGDEPVGILVRGKGLVQFTDASGKQWTLAEKAQNSLDGLTDSERATLNSPFPTEAFEAYCPYATGSTLSYVSETGERLDLPVRENSKIYIPYIHCGNDQDTCINKYESFISSQEMGLASDGNISYWSITCYMRKRLYWGYFFCRENTALSSGKFSYEIPLSTNDIFSALTDTIALTYNKSSEVSGIIVKGKGLTWFKDRAGNEWHLEE